MRHSPSHTYILAPLHHEAREYQTHSMRYRLNTGHISLYRPDKKIEEMIGAATDIPLQSLAQTKMSDLRMRPWIRSMQYTYSSTLTGVHLIRKPW